MDKIGTMSGASAAVAAFSPPPLVLASGETLYIHKLSWLDFNTIYLSITGVVQKWLTMQALKQQSENRDIMVSLAYQAAKDAAGADVAQNISGRAEAAAVDASQDVQSALKSLIEEVQNVPGVVEDLLTRTVRKGRNRTDDLLQAADMKAWDFDDVLEATRLAIAINFTENARIRDFFGGVMSALAAGKGEPTT